MKSKKLDCGCKITYYEVSKVLIFDKKCKEHKKFNLEFQNKTKEKFERELERNKENE